MEFVDNFYVAEKNVYEDYETQGKLEENSLYFVTDSETGTQFVARGGDKVAGSFIIEKNGFPINPIQGVIYYVTGTGSRGDGTFVGTYDGERWHSFNEDKQDKLNYYEENTTNDKVTISAHTLEVDTNYFTWGGRKVVVEQDLTDYVSEEKLFTEKQIMPQTPYVDLGLPSGKLWATCNIGANLPEEYGTYFSWGELANKQSYTWPNYTRLANGAYNQLTKYCNSPGYGIVDNKLTLEAEDDVSTQMLGEGWHIPSAEEIAELYSCTKERVTINNVNGLKITGPNGNYIFIPACGYYDGTNRNALNSQIYCWTNGIKLDMASRAYFFNYNGKNNDGLGRCFGLTVRPVYTPTTKQIVKPELIEIEEPKNEIFYARYNETNNEEIYEAYQDGKQVILVREDDFYYAEHIGQTYSIFYRLYKLDTTGTIYEKVTVTSSGYDIEEIKFETNSNKVTEITSDSTDTQYPSAKAVYTQINNNISAIITALGDYAKTNWVMQNYQPKGNYATTDDLLTYVTEDKTTKDVFIEPQHSVNVNTNTFLYNGFEVATTDNLSTKQDTLQHYHESDDYIGIGYSNDNSIEIYTNNKEVKLNGLATYNNKEIAVKEELYAIKAEAALYAEYVENRYQQKLQHIIDTSSSVQIGDGGRPVHLVGENNVFSVDNLIDNRWIINGSDGITLHNHHDSMLKLGYDNDIDKYYMVIQSNKVNISGETTINGLATYNNKEIAVKEELDATKAELNKYRDLLLLVNAKCVYTDFNNVKHAASANMAAVISTVKESKIIHITGNMDGITDAAHWFEGTSTRVTPCEEIEQFDASQIEYFYATFNKAKVLLPQHLNCYNNKTFVGCFDGYKGTRLPSKIECGSLQVVNASNYTPMYNNGYRGDIDPWRYCFSGDNIFTNLPTFNGLQYSPSAGNGRFNAVSTITPTEEEWKNFCEGLANPISGYNNFSFHTTVWNRIKALSNFAQYKQVAVAKGWTFND